MSDFLQGLHLALPSKFSSLLFIPLVLIGVCLTRVVYCFFLHPLHSVPGPKLAKFSHLWLNIREFRGSWHQDTLEIHKKYGPVVRIGPNKVSFVDPAAVKTLYGHGTAALKTKWYDTWIIPNLTVSFFASQDPTVHRHLRSRVTSAYSMTSILSMETFIQDVADENWAKFRKFSQRDEPVEMHRWASYFAFDVVSELAFGGRLGFIKKEMDIDGIIKSIHTGFYMMANMGNFPLQMWWLNNPFMQWAVRTFGGRELNAFQIFLTWLEARVEERMNSGLGSRRRDILQHFIEAKDMQKNPVKKGDVMIEGVNLLGAGADTTSIGIRAVLGEILLRPEIQKRLQAEVDEAYDRLGLVNEEISFKDVAKLPYLSAVVKESMRLHPSIQYQLPRYVPEGGIQIGKYHLPVGSECGICARSMNRCKEVFGEDADEFVPERWMLSTEISEEDIKRMDRSLATFGYGSRVCIGQNLALVEVHKYIAQFIRHFEGELVNKTMPWIIKSQWFAFQAKFWVKLKERPHERVTERLNGPREEILD